MEKIPAIVLLLILALAGQAQSQKFTLSGYIRAENTGEELIGATVAITEIPEAGVATNDYGFYSITLPGASYTLKISHLGYKPLNIQIDLTHNIKKNFDLEASTARIGEVVIRSDREDNVLQSTQMGIDKIDMKELATLPVLFGERDILKMIQMRPGVKSAGDGSSGFFVRGGKSDQNLILLDEATIYNATHLLGFFSVFNSDAIKDMTLYKGSQPAAYGGRLSSVLDIRMDEGNNKEYGVRGGIGLISSRLKVEGPIVKDRGSFSISGRRTYADMFLRASKDSNVNGARLFFYDLNLKANYRFNDKNRIYLSGYFGRDVLGLHDLFDFNWGNKTSTLRWNHLFSDRLFSNTSVIFSDFDYNIGVKISSLNAGIVSRIRDYNLKQDFQYYVNPRHSIRFGVNSIFHKIVPGMIRTEIKDTVQHQDLSDTQSWENAFYVSDEWKLNERWGFQYGMRFSSFSVLGPGTFYDFDEHGNATDSSKYRPGKFIKTYFQPEPRFSASYLLNRKSSLKISYARNTQHLHLLSNSTTGNPTDLWIPDSKNVKPEIADQLSVGYYRSFEEDKFEFSAETYYKALRNQVDYRDGAELSLNEKVESQLLYGIGRAYGLELLMKKTFGKLHGWIGYTLSRTERKIAGINGGSWYPAKQDRTHDISIVASYDFSKKWTFSANWVYYTGNAVTFPSGKYEIANQVVNYYTERNDYRMPAYHRLDISATWFRKKTDKFESSWNFSCYNAYGRENPYIITFKQDPDDPSRTQAIQTTLFRWVPSVSYNFKF